MINDCQILENGESLAVTKEQADFLVSQGYIYQCFDPECLGYHICGPDFTFDEIEEALIEHSDI